MGPRTVAKLLKTCGYRLQANAKVVEGRAHPDRDAQFEYVNAAAVAFLAAGDPVLSVDAKNGNWSAISVTVGGSGRRSVSRSR